MTQPSYPTYWQQAKKELSARDAVMKKIITRFKGEGLRVKGDAFYTLARCVVGQQISVKAADAIWARLMVASGRLSPKNVSLLSHKQLRSIGLSGQKVTYLQNLAQFFLEKSRGKKYFSQPSDQIYHDIIAIKGIGHWSWQMFQIFFLADPDVFPVSDIGLLNGIATNYSLDRNEVIARLDQFSQKWQPWRTAATWYLWRSLDPVPVAY